MANAGDDRSDHDGTRVDPRLVSIWTSDRSRMAGPSHDLRICHQTVPQPKERLNDRHRTTWRRVAASPDDGASDLHGSYCRVGAHMITTEEEAKTKWCPEVRTGLVHGMAVNHHVDMEPKGIGVYVETRCIGSLCMMWRIYCETIPPRQDIGTTHDQNPPTHGSGWTFVEGSETGSSWSRDLPGKPATGYCGKAGHP